MNNIKKISSICLFMLTLMPVFVFAQGPAGLQPATGAGTSKDNPLVVCGDDVTGTENDACGVDDIDILLRSAMNIAFIFAGFIVAGMFMYAGFLMITAAGNTSQIQKSKDIFKRVVIGFLIMFLSFILVKNLLTNIQAVEFFTRIFK